MKNKKFTSRELQDYFSDKRECKSVRQICKTLERIDEKSPEQMALLCEFILEFEGDGMEFLTILFEKYEYLLKSEPALYRKIQNYVDKIFDPEFSEILGFKDKDEERFCDEELSIIEYMNVARSERNVQKKNLIQ